LRIRKLTWHEATLVIQLATLLTFLLREATLLTCLLINLTLEIVKSEEPGRRQLLIIDAKI